MQHRFTNEPLWLYRLFPAVTLCVDELGGPTNDDSAINLLQERGWADGRWKKGRHIGVKRQSASKRAAIRDPLENTGTPHVSALWVWLHTLGHEFGRGTEFVDIAEPPSKRPSD